MPTLNVQLAPDEDFTYFPSQILHVVVEPNREVCGRICRYYNHGPSTTFTT